MIKEVVATADNDRDTMMKIRIDVSVTKDGIFTTTLNKEDAETIESYGVKLSTNRNGRAGFFSSDTLAGLIHKVHEVLKLCVSYKVVSLTPVIRYNFKTACHYIMDGNDPVPNGYYISNFSGHEWRSGTTDDRGFTSTGCYGVNVYAKPFMKRVVEYNNGSRKIFYDSAEFEKGSYMRCLGDFGGMSEFLQDKLYEMEGTEKNAKFFVDMIKSICVFNERLKGLLENDLLEKAINSKKELSFIHMNDKE